MVVRIHMSANTWMTIATIPGMPAFIVCFNRQCCEHEPILLEATYAVTALPITHFEARAGRLGASKGAEAPCCRLEERSICSNEVQCKKLQ
jgi:hypothetical protein